MRPINSLSYATRVRSIVNDANGCVLQALVSGFMSGGLYSCNDGKRWIKLMVLTTSLFPFMSFGIGFVLNIIAIFYGSLVAIPFGTMVVVALSLF